MQTQQQSPHLGMYFCGKLDSTKLLYMISFRFTLQKHKQINVLSNTFEYFLENNESMSGPSEQTSEPQSAKMLIFLQNGEQRLITFTLPKESCTLQEVLEQVCPQIIK